MLNSFTTKFIKAIINICLFVYGFGHGIYESLKYSSVWVYNAFAYKHGALMILGFPISLMVEMAVNSSFLGISITFIFLLVILMTTDFLTGVMAAKTRGEKRTSKGFSYTIYKFFSAVFFFWMLAEVNKLLDDQSGWAYENGLLINAFIRNFIFIILVFREFISIGENIEITFGKKPYIFILAGKIIDVVEDKFIKKIADSDICETKEKKNDENKS
jgi:hypothetical protein